MAWSEIALKIWETDMLLELTSYFIIIIDGRHRSNH
jgi:hypothetical protein